MTLIEYERQVINELATELKLEGYRVFIAERGNYGFYTDTTGDRVVSFQVDYLSPVFSGNYISQSSGTGWRFEHPLLFDQMLNASAPQWAIRGESRPVKYVTLQQHLDRYQKSSKYREVTTLPNAQEK